MRKETKYFSVEVKRRPNRSSKKSFPNLLPAPPKRGSQKKAASIVEEANNLFSGLSKAKAETDKASDASRAGRVLPCLVTEAAMEEAKAVEQRAQIEAAHALFDKRPVGRPRHNRHEDDAAIPAKRAAKGPPKKSEAQANETPKKRKPRAQAVEPVVWIQPIDPPAPYEKVAQPRPPANLELQDGPVWSMADVEPAASSTEAAFIIFRSDRARARSEQAAKLRRGERWKRRLPQTIW